MKETIKLTNRLLPCRSVCSVSFLKVIIIFNSDKITEGRTFCQGHSSPFPHRERCLLNPLVIPQSPASWPPRHDLTGLNPTRVAGHVVSIFTLTIDRTPQTPCRGTCRDVPRTVSEGVFDSRVVRRSFVWISESRAMYFETEGLYFEKVCMF